METPVGRKQRSPWFYALLGCGGLAGLICLGTMGVMFTCGKALSDVKAGVENPEERQKNALKQLGALPEGYAVVASVNVFFMQTTILTDGELLPDGGFDVGDGHVFRYFSVMPNEKNKHARDFLSGKETDAEALARSGIRLDAKDVVKRGQLSIDGRKYAYIASRGVVDGTEPPTVSLNNAILFDCPGETLHVGIWSQQDPSPEKAAAEVDLTGTVADEEKLAHFLKPMNPCAP